MKFPLWLLLISGMLAQAQEAKGPPGPKRRSGPPADGAAWVDEKSGFMIPQKMAGFVMESISEWEDNRIGTSVRLLNEKARARADIYVYPCPLPATTEQEKREAVETELRQSVAVMHEMQKRGTYSDVKARDGTFDTIDLLPDGSIPFAWSLVTMTIHQRTPGGDAPEPVTSWQAVAVFNGRFIKVRYTFPSDEAKQGEKALNEFVAAWQWCVREPGFQNIIRPAVRTYLADPLSAKAAEAAANVVTYAEKTSFIRIEPGPRLSACLEEAQTARKGAELDLMRAYITGCVDASLRSHRPSEPEAGAALMTRVYALLQKKHAGFNSPLLDELSAAVAEKRAGAWMEAKQAGKR